VSYVLNADTAFPTRSEGVHLPALTIDDTFMAHQAEELSMPFSASRVVVGVRRSGSSVSKRSVVIGGVIHGT
jgi:hypothetical protein